MCFSDTGIEYAGNTDEAVAIILVYDDFTDDIFTKLNSKNCSIIGPQIVLSAVETDPVSLMGALGHILNVLLSALRS